MQHKGTFDAAGTRSQFSLLKSKILIWKDVDVSEQKEIWSKTGKIKDKKKPFYCCSDAED
jgi:hypothetical protein